MESIKTVEEYILRHPERKDEIEKLRSLALALPFEECMKWSIPNYTIGGKNVVAIASFKHWSCIWFHQGAFLADKSKVLQNAQEGKTKGMRQWRFTNVDDINEDLVTSYLQEAIENQKAGKEIKANRKKAEKVEIPFILNEYLNRHLGHLKTFEGFTISQQNDFSNYIINAKREKTKLNRMEKIKDLLEEGKTLNSLWQGK